MKDCWYADNRDLVKWSVLLKLATNYKANRILQLAYYRPCSFGQFVIDGHASNIPKEVIDHFRNLRTISSLNTHVRITVFDSVFEDRQTYLHEVFAQVEAFSQERCIIFLDPDTGLEPQGKPNLKHVLNSEASAIWNILKNGDIFVIYQHITKRNGQPWIEEKQTQLSEALQVQLQAVKVAHAPQIASDVVFFFVQKI